MAADMRRVALVSLAVVVHTALLQAQAPSDGAGRVAFRIVPETVTVGQPFMVNLRAVATPGGSAVAPPVPDTGGIVEPLDPAVITRRGDTLLVRYRLIAWQPGVLTVPLLPVRMKGGSDDAEVPLDIRVVVASVLPADSVSRVPKAPRELFPAVAPWWEGWWRWLLALLVALGLIALLHRWRTRERPVVVADESPLSRAESAFARLDARGLTKMGEGGRHVTLATEIVRQYLADVAVSLPLTLTNVELLAAARGVAGIPRVRLAQLLEQSDMVRFSGTNADADTVRRVSGLARELVREMDRLRSGQPSEAA